MGGEPMNAYIMLVWCNIPASGTAMGQKCAASVQIQEYFSSMMIIFFQYVWQYSWIKTWMNLLQAVGCA